MAERLFDAPRQPRWTGSKALVRVDPDTCPLCGGPLINDGIIEEPLLRHGGYGAATATTRRVCSRWPCSYVGGTVVAEQRPGLP